MHSMPGMDCEVFDNPSFGGPPEQHVGTLYLDEFAAVNLRPGAVNRLVETGFETVTPNPTVRANAANGLLARIASSGPGMDLIPAWFPETTPNFNSYVQAETLLVFVNEYERTGNVAFRDAAQKIAAKLLSLQIPSGRTQSGAWYTSYGIQDGVLIPPDRASQPLLCDGNETLLQDIGACEWVGNVGWVLIALGKLQRSGFYNDPTALKGAGPRSSMGDQSVQPQPGSSEPDFPWHRGSISAYFGYWLPARKTLRCWATRFFNLRGIHTAPPEAGCRSSRRRDCNGNRRQWKLGSHVSAVARTDQGSVGLASVCGLRNASVFV